MFRMPSRQRRMTVSSFFVGTMIEIFGSSVLLLSVDIDICLRLFFIPTYMIEPL